MLIHPKSRLAAVGVLVTFHCKILDGREAHWVVNSINGVFHTRAVMQLEEKGFYVDYMYEDQDNTVTVLTLRVNATASKNGTKIYCTTVNTNSPRSDTALLLTIDGRC